MWPPRRTSYHAHHASLDRTDATSLLDRLLYTDTATYLHELLMKQDQMSMAASIESRVPFLDHKLVEFAAALPSRAKLRGLTTKWILREAMRDRLPREILTRPKMGFPVPLAKWLGGPLRSWAGDLLLCEQGGELRSSVRRKEWSPNWIPLWHPEAARRLKRD